MKKIEEEVEKTRGKKKDLGGLGGRKLKRFIYIMGNTTDLLRTRGSPLTKGIEKHT